MTNFRINLRNVATVVACLAVMTLFSGCTEKEDECDDCQTCEICATCPTCEECDEVCTVTFISGGEAVNVIRATNGDKLTMPVLKPREDAVFVGWYRDENFETAWNFATDAVTANVTLYAKWIVQLLEKVIYENGDYRKFEYDEQNRITNISWFNSGEVTPSDSYTLTYSGNDLVKYTYVWNNNSWIQTDDYIRSGNKIIATRTYNFNPNVETLTFDLNSDGTIAKLLHSQGNTSYEYVYQYQGGNLSKLIYTHSYNGVTVYSGTTEYQYDSKHSAFYFSATPKWRIVQYHSAEYGSKNNVVETSWEDSGKSVYAYEYDSDGFPTKRTEQYYDAYGNKDDDEWVTEYTYITKIQ